MRHVYRSSDRRSLAFALQAFAFSDSFGFGACFVFAGFLVFLFFGGQFAVRPSFHFFELPFPFGAATVVFGFCLCGRYRFFDLAFSFFLVQ
jgi:hypothetical protein